MQTTITTFEFCGFTAFYCTYMYMYSFVCCYGYFSNLGHGQVLNISCYDFTFVCVSVQNTLEVLPPASFSNELLCIHSSFVVLDSLQTYDTKLQKVYQNFHCFQCIKNTFYEHTGHTVYMHAQEYDVHKQRIGTVMQLKIFSQTTLATTNPTQI